MKELEEKWESILSFDLFRAPGGLVTKGQFYKAVLIGMTEASSKLLSILTQFNSLRRVSEEDNQEKDSNLKLGVKTNDILEIVKKKNWRNEFRLKREKGQNEYTITEKPPPSLLMTKRAISPKFNLRASSTKRTASDSTFYHLLPLVSLFLLYHRLLHYFERIF